MANQASIQADSGPSSAPRSKSSEAAESGAFVVDARLDGVSVIYIDVPGASVNSLQASFAQELDDVLESIERDETVRAIVIASGKTDSFVVGANIDMLAGCRLASDAEALSRAGQAGFRRLETAKKPIVAAIHGAALGGGFELALACHARVLSDDKKTVLGFPEIQLGLIPGANGLPRVAAIVGLQVALDLGLTGKQLRPSRAKRLGIADDVVPQSILIEVAAKRALSLCDRPIRAKAGLFHQLDRLKNMAPQAALTELALEDNAIGRRILFRQARLITQKKTKGHYPAAMAIIDVLETFGSRGFEAAAEHEARLFGELVVSETARQLIGIYDATQELKKDSGVTDPKVKPRTVAKVGVLGAGLMGAGIAYVTADKASLPVRVRDKDDAGVGRGLAYVGKILDGRVKRKSLTRLEKDGITSKISGTTTYDGFGRCDVVVEAVFEDLALKKQILADVEKKCSVTTIFASNTSSIPIGKIAEGCARPHNVVGMHYFSPVEKMPLLEVIRHKLTSDEAVATAVALGKKQGKTVIVVNDGVGFYTSRVLGPYMNEAAHLLAEGVAIDVIDKALVDWGFPVGPMTLLDEVGMDVAEHVGRIVHEAFGERMTPPAIMERLAKDDRKGRKNSRGMYLYDERGQKPKDAPDGGVDTSVYATLGVTPTTKVETEEVQMRCVLAFVNEALRCLGEGILRSPRDGDVGAIFGLGFPPFRGGPFRYVDAVGAAEVLRRIESFRLRFGARFEPAPTLVNLAKINGKFYR